MSYGEATLSVDPEVGIADSGDLESDRPELFIRVGEAAKAAGNAWTLLIDEVQYLRLLDLAALIVALHKIRAPPVPDHQQRNDLQPIPWRHCLYRAYV